MNFNVLLQIIFIILLILIIILLSIDINKENFKDCKYEHEDGKNIKHVHYGVADRNSCPDHSNLIDHDHDHNSKEELLFTLTGERTNLQSFNIDPVKFIINFYIDKHKDPVDKNLRCEIKSLYDIKNSNTGTTLKKLTGHNILIYNDSYANDKNKWWLFDIKPKKTDMNEIQTLCGSKETGFDYEKKDHYIYNLWAICHRRERSTRNRYKTKNILFNGGFLNKNGKRCYRGQNYEGQTTMTPKLNERNVQALDEECNLCLFNQLKLKSITNMKPYFKLTFFNLKNSCTKTLENSVIKESEDSLEITSNGPIANETSFSSFSIEYDEENKTRHDLMKNIEICNNKNKCKDKESIMISTMNNFEGHLKLKDLIIDKRITSIPKDSFKDIKTLERVYIPSNVETIGSAAFSLEENSAVELKVVFFPHYSESKLKIIEESTFENSNLKQMNPLNKPNISFDVIFPNIEVIKPKAFKNCKIGNVLFPQTLKELGDYCFSDNADLQTISFASVTETDPNPLILGKGMFQNCTSLTFVTLPSKITVIPEDAFLNCKNLASIVLPDSLQKIETGAFTGVKLDEIKYKNESYDVEAFKNIASQNNITIAEGAFEVPN